MTESHDTREQLLDAAKAKPVRQFVQIDAFTRNAIDGLITGDEDGDAVMLGVSYELRNTGDRDVVPVRISIAADADPEDVRRLLPKMVECVDAALRCLQEERERDLLARAGIGSEPF